DERQGARGSQRWASMGKGGAPLARATARRSRRRSRERLPAPPWGDRAPQPGSAAAGPNRRRSGWAPEAVIQESLCEVPIPFHRARGDAEHVRALLVREAGEEPQFDDPCLPRLVRGQQRERFVDREQDLWRMSRRTFERVAQGLRTDSSATLVSNAAAR